MKISNKLLIYSVVIFLVFIFLFVVMINRINYLQKINEIRYEAIELQTLLLKYGKTTHDLLSQNDLEEIHKRWKEEYLELVGSISKLHEAIQKTKMGNSEELEKHFESIDKLINLMEQQNKKVSDSVENVVATVDLTNNNLFDYYHSTSDAWASFSIRQVRTYLVFVDDSVRIVFDRINTSVQQEALSIYGRIISTLLLFFSSTALFFVVAFIIMQRGIRRSLKQFDASISLLGQKDFTHSIDESGKDEFSDIGRLVNHLIGDISSILLQFSDASDNANAIGDEVITAATESSAAVTEMTANIASIEKQTHNLVETLLSAGNSVENIFQNITALFERIEKYTSAINESIASVEQMNASVENVNQIAARRKEATAKLTEAVKTSGAKMEDANQLVKENSKEMEQIIDIINIINAIAEQTNLLSMNAAIEAAHAGDSGRGFAVVADEIRKLAESTNSNSRVIKSSIDNVAFKINQVEDASHESLIAFEGILKESEESLTAMAEISNSMHELSAGSGDILKTMADLGSFTKDIHDNSENMIQETDNLKGVMSDVSHISKEVGLGITEINIGVKDINIAMQEVRDLNQKNESNLKKLVSQIEIFKLT